MAKSRVLGVVGGWSAVILIVLAVSCCSELPKHRFEDRAAERLPWRSQVSMKRGKPSTTSQAASPRQTGPYTGTEDGVLALMRRYKMPMTRENYIQLAFMGEPPAEWTPEHEADLPPQFRRHEE
jgi:hypothetical protein